VLDGVLNAEVGALSGTGVFGKVLAFEIVTSPAVMPLGNPVPEPATVSLAALSLIGLGLSLRRRNCRTNQAN